MNNHRASLIQKGRDLTIGLELLLLAILPVL